MNYKLIIVAWIIFCVSVVYWDINRHGDIITISKCHNTEVIIVNDRPMCTTCKLYCDSK